MRRLIVVVVSAAIALTAAEIALRAFAPIYTVGIQKSYEYDAELGVRLKPSFSAKRVTDHLEEIRTNRLGIVDFRDDYSGYPAMAFALGDSYTQGTGLASDASYPAQLDQMVNRDAAGLYEKKTAILNLGLGSYGGEQSLLVFRRFSKLVGNPSWCLYAGSDNDYDDDLLFARGQRHRQFIRGSPRWKGFAEFLGVASNLQLALRLKVPLAQRRLGRIRAEGARPDSAARTAPPASVQQPSSIAEREWPVVERLIAACDEAGARTIVTWIPPGNMVSYDWLKARTAERGVAFNDWYPRVSSTLAAIPAMPLGNPHSGGHYRGWVAGQIAGGFLAEMERITTREALASTPASVSR